MGHGSQMRWIRWEMSQQCCPMVHSASYQMKIKGKEMRL